VLFQLLKKLIRASSGRSRFIMAVLGLSIALTLILAGIQLQSNYDQLLHGKNNQDSIADFLVINKQLTSSEPNASILSDAEIARLKQQPFVDALGILTPGTFKISLQSMSDRIPFQTDFAFESVPDEFIDINSKDWNWNEQSSYLPLIIPNMFLDIYNFQFSISQGMPQLTQQQLQSITFRVVIESPQGGIAYAAKVIGFSDRISAVLVPHSFMDWANKNFGSGASGKPSRVVIRTKDPGNPALVNYLKEHKLSTDADKTRFSKYREIVNVVVNTSWITGGLMLMFALLIFTLFIQLTIASAKDEIRLLLTLGASPRQLKYFLIKQFFPVNIIITIIVLALISVLQFVLQKLLLKQYIFVSSFISWPTITAAILVLLVLWIVNTRAIKSYLK